MGNNFYGNINVDDGIRHIGVNDKGDYISLSINDVYLLDRFSSLIEWFDNKQKELRSYGDEFTARHAKEIAEIDQKIASDDFDEGDEMAHNGMIIEAIRKRTETYRECCEKIDEVFGKDCCRKVFGEILPDEALLADFFEQMTPIIAKMANERGERLRVKYSRDKQGKKNMQRTKDELIAEYKSRKEGGA